MHIDQLLLRDGKCGRLGCGMTLNVCTEWKIRYRIESIKCFTMSGQLNALHAYIRVTVGMPIKYSIEKW